MNINVKLDGEDEQAPPFPNRATIALQSGPAAYINLNIVNPNINNPSYILNPVSQVPQNFVAYQSPVTLQSYITLQEADGNIVNNLQVGVPVPIGLPVPAELLHNPNLVNTSIIIGNDDCNQQVIFKPATTNVSEGNDVKFSYAPKPVVQDGKSLPLGDDLGFRFNDVNVENALKKPCPLEMSIKAANIDLEFEKCDPEDLMPEANGLLHTSGFPIIQKMQTAEVMPENLMLNIPLKIEEADESPLDVPIMPQNPEEVKKPKTEITWEDGGLRDQAKISEFQESLICEVEEANEEEENHSDDKHGESSDDNETLPLSVVLKLRRVQEDDAEGKNDRHDKKSKDLFKEDIRKSSTKKPSWDCDEWETELESKKFLKVRHCCSKRECFKKITLRDQRIAHKNFYDFETTMKQDTYLLNCIEHVQTNRQGSNYIEKDEVLEKNNQVNNKTLEETNMQEEIENESNGNQMLSDEIQKAIKESLKDCMVNQMKKEEDGLKKNSSQDIMNYSDNEEDRSNNWNYYIVIDRCRKRVCLQFLLKLFRITKIRVKNLQEKILSGHPLSDDSGSFMSSEKTPDVWDLVKSHLDILPGENHPHCKANPSHRYLHCDMTIESLFEQFRDFYKERTSKDVKMKLYAYKRFVKNDCNVSLGPSKVESCSECDLLEEQSRKNKKRDKSPAIEDSLTKLDRRFQTKKKGRKKWEITTESDCSSDDEPLAKRKKLRLTISLKGNRAQNTDKSRPVEADKRDKRPKKKTVKEGKGKGNSVKGRDVWSLMLLHLETMNYKVCKNCVSRKRHRFFDASMTKQALYEDYRRYFLKETNSELGLGFTMYEKYFDRNCGYTIGDVDVNSPVCPRCELEPPKPESVKSTKKSYKNHNNNIKPTRYEEKT